MHLVGLRALLSLRHLELDALTLLKGLVTVHVDRAVVNEDVTSAIDGDEAVALLAVEPLHRALRHNDPSLLDPRPPGRWAPRLPEAAWPGRYSVYGSRDRRRGMTRRIAVMPAANAATITTSASITGTVLLG